MDAPDSGVNDAVCGVPLRSEAAAPFFCPLSPLPPPSCWRLPLSADSGCPAVAGRAMEAPPEEVKKPAGAIFILENANLESAKVL